MQPPENTTTAGGPPEAGPAPASLDRAGTRLRQAVGYLDEWHARLTDVEAGRSYVTAGHDALAAIDATLRALYDARAVLVAEIRRDEDDRAARVDELLAGLRKPDHANRGDDPEAPSDDDTEVTP